MTLEEKIGQMGQINVTKLMVGGAWERGPLDPEWAKKILIDCKVGSILSGGGATPLPNKPEEWVKLTNQIQKIAIENTRLGIPIIYGIDAIHGHNNVCGATIFPHNIGMAATRNPALVENCASLTAKEVRATGIRWTFSPIADVARDIRWGRTYETFGEDPYTCAAMVAAKVRGYQGENFARGGVLAEDKILACPKHFVGYGGAVRGQDRGTAYIPMRVLRGIHLLPFRAAIDAGVITIMACGGEINGQPVHSSSKVLTEILRGELGFDGFLLSDWGELNRLWGFHHVASSWKEGIRMGVNAGIDMDMVPLDAEGFQTKLSELIEEGKVSEERIDEAVRRILTVKFRSGLFEQPYTELENVENIVGCEEHRKVALQAAKESIVLLKNERDILPLSKDLKTILVAGGAADDIVNQVGGWTIGWQGARGMETPPGITILEGIKNKVSPETEVAYVKSNIEEAKEAAKTADAAIVVVGEYPYAEGFGDRTDLELPKEQKNLVEAIYGTGVPTIMVLVAGRPLIITDIYPNIRGLLMAWLPGSEGGNAVADLLFGDYNPSGKLPVTWPRTMGQLPMWYDYAPSTRKYNPLFEFGFGLSYTKFRYSNLRLSSKNIRSDEEIGIGVDVKNIGTREGAEVIHVYIRDLFSSLSTPFKKLYRFEKVTLKPGENKTVTFTIPAEELGFYTEESPKRVLEPGTFEVMINGLSKRFEVI